MCIRDSEENPLEKFIKCAKFSAGSPGRTMSTLGGKVIFTHIGDRWVRFKLGGPQHVNDRHDDIISFGAVV
jgi:hypothetical protein